MEPFLSYFWNGMKLEFYASEIIITDHWGNKFAISVTHDQSNPFVIQLKERR